MHPLVLRSVTLWNPGSLPVPGQTIVVERGSVEWIGPDAEAPTTAELHPYREVEAEGRLLTPAFVDSHAHVSTTGEVLGGVDLSATRSLTEALDLVAEAATARPGLPIFAHGWDETNWPENRPFTCEELDRASGDGVVHAPRVDLHAACVSSSLAAVAAVTTKDGWDGRGMATRAAQDAVVDAWAASVGPDARRRNIELALHAAARAGIGTVHEMGTPNLSSRDDVREVVQAGGNGAPRTVGYWGEVVSEPHHAVHLREALGVTGLGGDIYLDGSFGAHNAGVLEPYTDRPSTTGDLYLTVSQATEHLVACTVAGVQGGFHCIGDAAIELAAEALEKAIERLGVEAVRSAHHRLEHVELPSRRAVETFARLGVTCAMQPRFEALWGGPDDLYALRLGDRWRRTNPWARLDDLGVPVSFGSDSPVTPWDPWGALRACVEPRNEAGRLPAARALSLHTEAGWTTAGLVGGRLRVGGEADLALWDLDWTTALTRASSSGADPDRLLDELVAATDPGEALLTVVDGHLVHDAGL